MIIFHPNAATIPLMVDVRGRRCLVAGDTDMARARAKWLREAGADVVAGTEPTGGASWDGVWLVWAATGSPERDAELTAEAHRRGILANAHDQPAASSFYMPAILRRGPLSIAVGTDGTLPALAVKVRDALAAIIGPEAEPLIEAAAAKRRESRDQDWDALLAPIISLITGNNT